VREIGGKRERDESTVKMGSMRKGLGARGLGRDKDERRTTDVERRPSGSASRGAEGATSTPGLEKFQRSS
jgi:hypothetical protein